MGTNPALDIKSFDLMKESQEGCQEKGKNKTCELKPKKCTCGKVGEFYKTEEEIQKIKKKDKKYKPPCQNGGPKVHCGNCIKDYSTHKLCQCKKEKNRKEVPRECDARAFSKGITEIYNDVMEFRVSKKTGYNPESSRGHLVLTLWV